MHFSNICLPTRVSTADRGSSNKYISACLYTALKSNIDHEICICKCYSHSFLSCLAKFILALCPPLKDTPLSSTIVSSPNGNCSKSFVNAQTCTTYYFIGDENHYSIYHSSKTYIYLFITF